MGTDDEEIEHEAEINMTIEPKPAKPVNPMVPFLARALIGLLLKDGRDLMKIVEVIPGEVAPYGFEVQFASGLRVSVKVETLEDPA